MYRTKEDFASMFRDEARKCGADGVIFKFLSGFSSGSVTAYATGVKLLGKAAGLTDSDKIKAFSLAIQSHDLAKVKELLAPVPKSSSERAPSDDQMVNLGLYIAALDGLNCDAKIVNLLEKEYEARVPKFRAIDMFGGNKSDSDTPLCRDVMARSLPSMTPLADAVLQVNNHYVRLLNYSSRDLEKKAAKYEALLVTAAKIIQESCHRSSTDPICAMKGAYLDFAKKSSAASVNSVKKNGAAVRKILGG
jgi:hypothetical protein